MTTVFSICAIALYFALGYLLGKRLFGRHLPAPSGLPPSGLPPSGLPKEKRWIMILAPPAIILHTIVLYYHIFIAPENGLNFGFFIVISLITWLIAILITVASITKPVANLGIAIFPLAGVAIVLANIFPSKHIILPLEANNLRLHIVISIVAYSLLSIAAIQSVLLAIQNKYLRNKHPGGFIRALPPLETMESLLFQMISVGFVLQSFSLLTGLISLEDMFEQHLVHKTVLSLVSWAVFAILLWGRWRFGWRGRTAIRWTLSGFTILLVAYFGSKMVLEIILGR